jgi:hypothetical protein
LVLVFGNFKSLMGSGAFLTGFTGGAGGAFTTRTFAFCTGAAGAGAGAGVGAGIGLAAGFAAGFARGVADFATGF